jgi:hypothetical protein
MWGKFGENFPLYQGAEVQFRVLWISNVIGRKSKQTDSHTPVIRTDLVKYLSFRNPKTPNFWFGIQVICVEIVAQIKKFTEFGV